MKLKKSTLFYKYFYEFFLNMLIFVIIITILMSYFFIGYIKKNETARRIGFENQANQIMTNISNELSKVFAVMTAIPYVYELENLNIDTASDDRIYHTTRPFIDVMSYNLLSSNYVNSLCIYSPQKNYVLSNSGFHYNNSATDYIWYYDGLVNDASQKKYWTSVIHNSRTNNNYIAVYKTNNNGDIDIALVDMSKVENSFSKIASELPDCTCIIWNKQENFPILGIGKNCNLSQIYQNHTASSGNNILIHTFSYSAFDVAELNWKCVFEYDNKQLMKYVYLRIMVITLFSIFIMMLLAVVISYSHAKNIYLPIKNVISALDELNNKDYEKNLFSDYKYSETKYIIDTILKNIQDKNQLQSELETNIEKLKEANKYALQMQIKPHFIYNTLEIVYLEAYKMFGDENIISEMVWNLSDMMRLAFKNDSKLIYVNEELSYVEKYIYLQSIRFENLFDTEWDIDKTSKECLTPKLILQPIVENAIVHGIIPAKKHCTLKVKSKHDNGSVRFIIEDDGVGITPEKLNYINNTLNTSNDLPEKTIGIANVNMRIKLMFGKKYGCKVISPGNSGTITEIIIPEIFSQEHL